MENKHYYPQYPLPSSSFIALWGRRWGFSRNYVTILLITNGGPGIQTEVWCCQPHKAFNDQQYGYGAAISPDADPGGTGSYDLMNKVMQKQNEV